MSKEVKTIEQYISSFPEEVQEKLSQVRALIKEVAPEAKEYLFYKVPAMTLKTTQQPKDGLMFAAFKRHIGLYPKPEVIKHFKNELAVRKLKYAEGTIQFALDKPLPIDLIRAIIEYKKAHHE